MPITKPTRPRPPRDPIAVAIGNGSLLGVGYGMLGRRLLAVLTATVTVTLAVLLATAVRTLWLEIVVVAWWGGVIAHGWYLATKRSRPEPGPAKQQRLVALAVALPILLIIGALRFDAARIDGNVADARAQGDCTSAVDLLNGRWVGHRIVNAPLSVEGDNTVRACDELRQASASLDAALHGNTNALPTGMAHLRTVVNDLPGHEKMAEHVLDRFLDALPKADPCDVKVITDTLRTGHRNKTLLDRTVDIVPKIAPPALIQCGDQLMMAKEYTQARDRYQQLLDQYPDHKLAGRAKDGVTRATQAYELATVRERLTPTGDLPEYCTNPAPYSAAPAYGTTRPNRALFYGNDEYTNRLPAEWKATDPADAVLIICAEDTQFGNPVETCPYENSFSPFGYTDVTFKTILIPVRVFELKTGRVVTDARVEIRGASCPAWLEYYSPTGMDLGPPSETYVNPSDPEVHAGFTGLVNP